MLMRPCMTDGKMRAPPGVPIATHGLASFKTRVGDMLLRMRLPPAMEFVRPGVGSINFMQLLRSMPVPGVVTREPNAEFNVWVALTIVPSESITFRCVVFGDPIAETPAPYCWAVPLPR